MYYIITRSHAQNTPFRLTNKRLQQADGNKGDTDMTNLNYIITCSHAKNTTFRLTNKRLFQTDGIWHTMKVGLETRTFETNLDKLV